MEKINIKKQFYLKINQKIKKDKLKTKNENIIKKHQINNKQN